MNYDGFSVLMQERYVAKFGGVAIGPLTSTKLGPLMPALFEKKGLPLGIVYSAPEGVTMSLRALCDSLDAGEGLQRVLSRAFSLYYSGFQTSATVLRNQVVKLAGSEDSGIQFHKRFLDACMRNKRAVADLWTELRTALLSYHRERSSNCEKVLLSQYRAVVLSMGERLFKEIVMVPFGYALHIFGVSFVSLDPGELLRAKSCRMGYIGVEIDFDASLQRLCEEIGRHGDLAKHAGATSVFVMPGFYLGDGTLQKNMACMPFNASDLSAEMLRRALCVGGDSVSLTFVKHVEGEAPRSATELRETQRKSADTRELVMGKALDLLIEAREDFDIFDPRSGKIHAVPSGVLVGTG